MAPVTGISIIAVRPLSELVTFLKFFWVCNWDWGRLRVQEGQKSLKNPVNPWLLYNPSRSGGAVGVVEEKYQAQEIVNRSWRVGH